MLIHVNNTASNHVGHTHYGGSMQARPTSTSHELRDRPFS